MTRKDKANAYNIFIYYCNLYTATTDSNKIRKNEEKLKIRKYGARLCYEKNKREYYLEMEHSKFC